MMLQASRVLAGMPKLASFVSNGSISWAQLRSIVCAVRGLRAPERAAVDDLIGSHAEQLRSADPDALIHLVDRFVADASPAKELAREDELIARNFLCIQGRLDGGSTLYGQADPESTATITGVLDARAARPRHPDDPGAPTRAAQRFDALVHLCEDWLAGSSPAGSSPDGSSPGHTRPRPRLLATIDLDRFQDKLPGSAMEVLWSLTGRAPRLSRVTADTLLCDATIVPVLTYKGRPLALGDAVTPTSDKVRTALIARDKGCRFPGCGAPASWCDVHHIIPGVGNSIDDLILLCRRCHRRIHRHQWRITLHPTTSITFAHRHRTYRSPPPSHASPMLN